MLSQDHVFVAEEREQSGPVRNDVDARGGGVELQLTSTLGWQRTGTRQQHGDQAFGHALGLHSVPPTVNRAIRQRSCL